MECIRFFIVDFPLNYSGYSNNHVLAVLAFIAARCGPTLPCPSTGCFDVLISMLTNCELIVT
jgi:hypothetical protein